MVASFGYPVIQNNVNSCFAFCSFSLIIMDRQRGDDLVDDYVADDIVAQSDEEEVDLASSLEDEAPSPSTSASALPQPSSQDPTKAKKRKRREKAKEKKAKVCKYLVSSYYTSFSAHINFIILYRKDDCRRTSVPMSHYP